MSSHKLLEAFSDLQFNEAEHRYNVNGLELHSVTKTIEHKFCKEFDLETISANYAKKHNRTQEDVKKEWKEINEEACERGNTVHNFAEDYLNGKIEKLSEPQQIAALEWINNLPPHYIFVCAELRMYLIELGLAGTADLIYVNAKNGRIIIADWKTNKDIDKRFANQTLKTPFDDIADSPFGHYKLQLSMYQLFLEAKGFKVDDRILIWLKMDGTYEERRLEDLSNRLKLALTQPAPSMSFLIG